MFAYGRFGEDQYGPGTIALDQFDAHLAELADGGHAVLPLPVLLEKLAHGWDLARSLLIIWIRHEPWQAKRHDVLPGVTGWAQVNGLNAIGWDERLSMDVYYVENWSLALDLYVLVMTLKSVALREGIAHAGHATMPEFSERQRWSRTLPNA